MDVFEFDSQPELAEKVSDFLTVAAVSEVRAYPVNAKYHMNAVGVPMTLHTRAKDPSILTENAILRWTAYQDGNALRAELGLKK